MSYTQAIQQDTNTIICPKHDIILMKTPRPNEYKLTFSICNHKIDLSAVLGWKIYDLLFSLNKDILSDRYIEQWNPSDLSSQDSIQSKHFIYVFKRFGAELGISQRYLSFNVECESINKNELLFISSPNMLTKDSSAKYFEFMSTYPRTEHIISDFSRFSIKKISPHRLDVSYDYHIDLQEELPASMKNIAGILIKKLFWRFKTCIENLE